MENNEKERKKGSAPYYDKRPQFGNKGPSKLRQQFSRGMTYFLVIVAGVLFYFALLRLDEISGGVTKVVDVLKPIIYGLAIAYLLNPIVKTVDRYLVPVLEKKLTSQKAKKLSRGIGAVSYTHLDVYKRQTLWRSRRKNIFVFSQAMKYV